MSASVRALSNVTTKRSSLTTGPDVEGAPAFEWVTVIVHTIEPLRYASVAGESGEVQRILRRHLHKHVMQGTWPTPGPRFVVKVSC